MPKKVRIPTPLRKLTNNEELVEINAATIGEAIIELQTRFPGIQERLVDEKGEVRRFVNVYVNEEDIRFLKNKQTPLKDGDEISLGGLTCRVYEVPGHTKDSLALATIGKGNS